MQQLVSSEGFPGKQIWQPDKVYWKVFVTVNTQGKRRWTPPFRRRYKAAHPTGSFGVDLDLYAQLTGLQEKANLSVADVLKVGLERCDPLVVEAHHTGFMGGLAKSYAVACDDCQDQVMAIAQVNYSVAPN